MSLEGLDRAIDWLKRSQVYAVQLVGGEPMLHPNIIEIVKKLKKRGIPIRSILTNGLADTKLYKEALDIVRTSWLVNINHPSTYNAGEWELLNRNLELLKWEADKEPIGHREFDLRNLSLQFAITFHKPDQDYRYIIETARKYNSAIIRYDVSHPCSDKSNVYIDFEHLIEVKPVLMKFLRECVREEIQPQLDCILPPCTFTSEELRFLLLHAGVKSICNPTLDLMPDLKIGYCILMRDVLPSYSIEAMSLPEIVRSQLADSARLRGQMLPRCRGCPHFMKGTIPCQGFCLRLKANGGSILDRISRYVT